VRDEIIGKVKGKNEMLKVIKELLELLMRTISLGRMIDYHKRKRG
jgi:hypothetical protein